MSYMKYLDPIFNDDPSNHLDYDPKSHILDPQENNENIRGYINSYIQQNPKLIILILYALFTPIALAFGMHTIYYPQIEGVI